MSPEVYDGYFLSRVLDIGLFCGQCWFSLLTCLRMGQSPAHRYRVHARPYGLFQKYNRSLLLWTTPFNHAYLTFVSSSLSPSFLTLRLANGSARLISWDQLPSKWWHLPICCSVLRSSVLLIISLDVWTSIVSCANTIRQSCYEAVLLSWR